MDYFKILNLIREPFSNSPEPDFFFHSSKHIRCLQKIELAIRLRRGLNVVMGHVGTGKTTLCRRLISQFAETGEGADAVETHLLMDPSFSTPQEFLATVAMSFGIIGKQKRRSAPAETYPLIDPVLSAPLDLPATKSLADAAGKRTRKTADQSFTDWQLKEKIKDYLFKKGVDEKIIVALIIDEGQKLPDFCLEILREFLNYETNENKLLQIVIFGQPEFRQILDRMENVADRVNLLYVLEPLNLRETFAMIRYRLTQASEPEDSPKLFSRLGLLAIYLATDGYPRKIITLCHQVLLAMIIQNRSQAGWFLARSCAARLASGSIPWYARSLRWVPGVLIALAALVIFFTVRPATNGSVKTPPPLRDETVRNESTRPIQPVQNTISQQKPDLLGTLALKNGRTIWWMLSDCYGEYDKSLLRSLAQANPHIKNLGRVQAGELIHLPALPAENSPLSANKYWVKIAASTNLEETYEFYRTHKPEISSVKFLPYWNPREGMVFSVILKDGFSDESSARQRIAALPAALASGASVVRNPGKDTVFYTR